MRIKILAIAVLVVSSFASSGAQAAACSGTPAFVDVAAADFFCTDTEWLKNRAVTLGCGGAFYCPGEFVTRGQMAAFMQRLGTVLVGEPRTNDIASGALALTNSALNNPICPITTIPPAAFGRTLVVTAHASFLMSSTPTGGRGDIGIQIINTVDGNTNNYSIATANPQRTSADPLFHTSVSHGAVIVMAAGQAVKVAIGALALPGSPNSNVAAHACQITVTPYSRTGNSSPFDE